MPRGEMDYCINISPEKKYIYVETPKVGCTKIKLLLYQLHHGQEYSLPQNTLHDNFYRLSDLTRPVHMNAFRFDQAMRDYYVFAFCRNPFNRVVSAYRDKIIEAGSKQESIDPEIALRDDALNRDRRMTHFGTTDVISFGQFIRTICEMPKRSMDSHWRGQYEILRPDIIPYDFIGRLERFSEDLVQVFSCGLGVGLDEKQVAKRENTTGEVSVRDYFDDELAALYHNKFIRDFEYFGYPAELPE